MDDGDEERLLEKLARIEDLHAGATSSGERTAAAAARERIRERLRGLEESDPAIELRFTLPDLWQRKLFSALARRYGLVPYRERGQRRTTTMLRAPRRFLENTFWPEFCELADAMGRHLEVVTERLIAKAVHADVSEGEEAPKSLTGAASPGPAT